MLIRVIGPAHSPRSYIHLDQLADGVNKINEFEFIPLGPGRDLQAVSMQ
jgi:hypothetical protein